MTPVGHKSRSLCCTPSSENREAVIIPHVEKCQFGAGLSPEGKEKHKLTFYLFHSSAEKSFLQLFHLLPGENVH